MKLVYITLLYILLSFILAIVIYITGMHFLPISGVIEVLYAVMSALMGESISAIILKNKIK